MKSKCSTCGMEYGEDYGKAIACCPRVESEDGVEYIISEADLKLDKPLRYVTGIFDAEEEEGTLAS